MSTGVLFVCLGNICRSPTAEGLFRHRVQQAGLDSHVRIDSCGTGSWHVGQPPDPRAVEAAAEHGFDISGLRARQLCAADYRQFDYLLAMDEDNLAVIERFKPLDSSVRFIGLATHFASNHAHLAVPDPYFSGGFVRVLEFLEDAMQGLMHHLAGELR